MSRNFKKLSVLFLVLVLTLSLVSCGNKENPQEDVETSVEEVGEKETGSIKVEDEYGRVFESEEPAKTVVSLAPSNTEILFALGLDDEIIGVTSFCNYPEKALEKEQIGGFSEINLEKIIELNPDLVVASGEGDPDVINRLLEADIQVLGYDPNDIDSIVESIKSIGLATGKNDEAEVLSKEILDGKDEIVKKVEGLEPVRAIYEIWHDPITAAGKGSFIDSLITLANGENIAQKADGEYPIFDVETLIEEDPEVYFLSSDASEEVVNEIANRPGFSDVTAVKEGQIFVLDADTTLRPGPRIIEALTLIAESLHPEIK